MNKKFKPLNMVLIFFVLSFTFLSCASSGNKNVNVENSIQDSSVKIGLLDNGMHYYIKENAEPKNRIELRLVVKAGSCMEDDDQKGIAHFVEHMCYNGTKNFEKSAIVDYFESLGMAFGPEINAETSFENTTYIIQLPADNPEFLKKGLLVLHDWASEVTFNQEELDKERGVIVEEWRARKLGLGGRVSESEINYFLEGSRYAERMPIGDVDIIKTIPRQRVVDFYKKWYRPEFMSVVAVGDFKTEQIEKEITEIMGQIASSKDTLKHPEFDIPGKKGKTIEILQDDEAKYTEIVLANPKNNSVIKNKEDKRKFLAEQIGENAFNQRINEIITKADAKWLSAGLGNMGFTNTNKVKCVMIIPKEGETEDAIKRIFDEVDRFTEFGITEAELERIKGSFVLDCEQNLLNLEKTTSGNYCNSLISSILTGSLNQSPKDYYTECKQIIQEITADEVNSVFNEYFGNRGTMCYILTPGRLSELPSKEVIMDIWKNYKNESIEQYENKDIADLIMDRPSKKAKITDKKKNKSLGVTEYTLENGVKIITKKTDNEKDSIIFCGLSKGGSFKLDEKDIPSSSACIDYAMLSGINDISYSQLLTKLQEKNVNFGLGIYNTEENIYGSSNNKNLELLMQCVYQAFVKEDFSDDAWKLIMDSYEQQAKAFGTQPNDIFNKKIKEIRYGKTNFYSVFDENYLSQIDKEKSKQIFKERFNNPADFTYVFVGDINEKELLDLCCRYLGTLKTSDEREEIEYVYFPFPEGINKATVKKGIDKQGSVYISLGGKLPESKNIDQNYKEKCLLSNLIYYLDIRLREIVREDKSGTYGVSVNGYIDGNPERFNEIYINFGCEPEREEELIKAVFDELNKVKVEDVSEENLTKIRENIIRGNENREKNNNWWLGRINSILALEIEPEWVSKPEGINKVADWVTVENLKNAANTYLNTNNYINVNLVPEK